MTLWYPVESHMGTLSFTRTEPDPDSLYCEECNDSDMVYAPVDLSDPVGVMDLATVLFHATDMPPMPWDDDLDDWFTRVEANLDMIRHEAPEPVTPDATIERLRERIRDRWEEDGLAPFDHERCVDYWTADTRRHAHAGADRLAEADWAYGPAIPNPWLGCLLEARIHTLPDYGPAWISLANRWPDWAITPMLDDDGRPVTVPASDGHAIPIQWVTPMMMEEEHR